MITDKARPLTKGKKSDRVKVHGQSIVDCASFATEFDPGGREHQAHTWCTRLASPRLVSSSANLRYLPAYIVPRIP